MYSINVCLISISIYEYYFFALMPWYIFKIKRCYKKNRFVNSENLTSERTKGERMSFERRANGQRKAPSEDK